MIIKLDKAVRIPNSNIILEKGETIKVIKEGKGYSELVSSFSDREFKDIHKVASTFNRERDWSIYDAILLAYLVCEDVNADTVCSAIEKAFERLN